MLFLNRFRNFDVYAKPVDDCRVKTSFGGLITLISFLVIGLLFINEIFAYLSVEVSEQLFVDSTNSDMKVDINFDIVFHQFPCDFASVDIIGLGGEVQEAIEDNVFKQRLNANGEIITGTDPEKQEVNIKKENSTQTSVEKKNMCGSCYGAIEGCCNTCEEVQEAYLLRQWQITDLSTIEQCKNEESVRKFAERKNEGCRIYGHIEVGKVSGNLHIAPGNSKTGQHSHYHDFKNLSPFAFNTSHTFNHFSFGKPFPNKAYPLDGKQFVVPTAYVYAITDSGREELSHQFSITRRQKDTSLGTGGIPGLFVVYEFSPLMVRYQEKRKSFTNFAVSLCAIIGGVFTVASLLDSFIYSGSRVVQRKFQLAKSN